MPIQIHGKEYKTVAERVNEFRSKHGESYSIETDIIKMDGVDCVIKATIRDLQGRAIATGLAHEVAGSTNINKTSHVENCETSAVGRALAAFGLAGTEYASGDEVSTAVINQRVIEAQEKLLRHNQAVRDNLLSIQALKDFLAGDELEDACEIVYGWPEDVRMALWLAPTKGGIFTTAEIAKMKSNEWSKATAALFARKQQ